MEDKSIAELIEIRDSLKPKRVRVERTSSPAQLRMYKLNKEMKLKKRRLALLEEINLLKNIT